MGSFVRRRRCEGLEGNGIDEVYEMGIGGYEEMRWTKYCRCGIESKSQQENIIKDNGIFVLHFKLHIRPMMSEN